MPWPTRLGRRAIPALALLTLLGHGSGLLNGFLNWDDPLWILENPLWDAPNPLRSVWFSGQAPQYYPLYFTFVLLQRAVWAAHPLGYHAVSILLHFGVAVGLFQLLRRLGLSVGACLMASAIFAVHPIQVATVAWATEQKTLAGSLFVLWAFERYARWVQSEQRRHFAESLLLFGAGMLCKTQPLLLVFLFPSCGRGAPLSLRRWIPILPFLGIAAGLAGITLVLEKSPFFEGSLGLVERVIVMSSGLWFYIGKVLWPVGLSGLYPTWRIDPADATSWLAVSGVAGLASLALWRATKDRHVLQSIGLFVLPWIPASGLVPFGHMEKAFVADHLIYLSLSGPAMGVGLILSSLQGRFRRSQLATRVASIALCIVVAVLSAASAYRCRDYADSVAFWSSVLRGNPESPYAHNGIGVALMAGGDLAAAAPHLRSAVEIRPTYYEGHMSLGILYAQVGDTAAALAEYGDALRIRPGDTRAREYMRMLQGVSPGDETSRLTATEAELRTRASIEPAGSGEAQLALAVFLTETGRTADALQVLTGALTRPLAPGSRAQILSQLGFVLAMSRRYSEALEYYQQEILIDPRSARAHMNAGVMLRRLGRFEEAMLELEHARTLDPKDPLIRSNIAKALRRER